MWVRVTFIELWVYIFIDSFIYGLYVQLLSIQNSEIKPYFTHFCFDNSPVISMFTNLSHTRSASYPEHDKSSLDTKEDNASSLIDSQDLISVCSWNK